MNIEAPVVEIDRKISSEEEILAQTTNSSQIIYRSPVRDGYLVSSCRLKKIKLLDNTSSKNIPKEALAIEFEFVNNRGDIWIPNSFVLGRVDGSGKLGLWDHDGKNITSKNLKIKGNSYKNNFTKVSNVPGVYEFDFFDSSDFKSIKKFSAVLDSGWGDIKELTKFEPVKKIQAQCRFL